MCGFQKLLQYNYLMLLPLHCKIRNEPTHQTGNFTDTHSMLRKPTLFNASLSSITTHTKPVSRRTGLEREITPQATSNHKTNKQTNRQLHWRNFCIAEVRIGTFRRCLDEVGRLDGGGVLVAHWIFFKENGRYLKRGSFSNVFSMGTLLVGVRCRCQLLRSRSFL